MSDSSIFTIDFYDEDDGTKPVLEWIRNDLTPYQRQELGRAMRRVLQVLGVGVCATSFGKQLGSGLFEFRLREEDVLLRVLCHAYGLQIILLFSGYDKEDDSSPKRQNAEITAARRRLAHWRAPSPLTICVFCHKVGSMPGKDFDELLTEIDREAEAQGPEAVMRLRALDVKYWMVGQIVKRRQELGMTQEQLAERVGIAQAEISRIERGRVSPTLETYSRLAAALELQMPELEKAVAQTAPAATAAAR